MNKKQETYIATWISGADLERWTPGRYEVVEHTVEEMASGRVMVSRTYFHRVHKSVGRYECIVVGKRLGVEQVSSHIAHR
jgi:hypothetical protein